jgi:hypothetical protein
MKTSFSFKSVPIASVRVFEKNNHLEISFQKLMTRFLKPLVFLLNRLYGALLEAGR